MAMGTLWRYRIAWRRTARLVNPAGGVVMSGRRSDRILLWLDLLALVSLVAIVFILGARFGTREGPPTHMPNPAPIRSALPVRASRMLMLASWYGREHAGRITASGEVFDPSLLTCAHKTLPFNTLLRLQVAGHTAIVRVNDRGPFVKDRDLDISMAAAEQLGMIDAGLAVLSVEEVRP